MPETFTALILTLLGVLPGAIYTWAFEQQAGRWGVTASDRAVRFGGVSAVLLALEAPLIYECYRRFVVTGNLQDGRALSAWTWGLPVLFVLLPFLAGRCVGRATYQRRRWAMLVTGPTPAPRAWDDLFAQDSLNGWIVVKLKSGGWLGGLWSASTATGLRSYAAGYPESQDLLIAETAEVDADGNFVLDPDGHPLLTGVAALVRWDEVDYAVFARA